MTAAFWTGWPGIDLRWRPGGVGIAFACGNVGRRKRERNAARGVVADEAWRNREALMPLVDWGPAETRRDARPDCGARVCPNRAHMSWVRERRAMELMIRRLFVPP